MEVECIPVSEDDARFIVYRPLARLAFIGNLPMAELAVAAARGQTGTDRDGAVGFLRSIGFLDPDPEAPPPAAGDFKPTTAVLLPDQPVSAALHLLLRLGWRDATAAALGRTRPGGY